MKLLDDYDANSNTGRCDATKSVIEFVVNEANSMPFAFVGYLNTKI